MFLAPRFLGEWHPGEAAAAVSQLTTGALAAFLLYRFVRRTPWPRPFRYRFVLLHGVVAVAFEGVALIVEDWVNRAIADPRVNWERKGITKGGFGFDRGQSVEWPNTPENGTKMKKHIAQFLTLSTGGAPLYEGKEMKAAHGGMHISNAEFDAAVGDLKASLDNLGVPTEEQKELLAIIESTRPQIAAER
jgi:hypothetical protein